jgi:O-antigen/teichoic acid export membrane protein
VKRNVAWTSAGYAVYTLCQWIILLVVARLIGVRGVGQLGFALAVCAPITLFTNLGLRIGQATDARSEFPFGIYWSVRILGSVAAYVLVVLLTLVLDQEADTERVVLLVGVTKFVEAQCDVFYGLFQRHERMDLMARSLIVRGVIGVVALTLACGLSGRLEFGLAAQAAAWLAVFLLLDLRHAVRIFGPAGGASPDGGEHTAIRPSWSAGPILALCRRSLPLGFSGSLISLRQATPRLVVERLLGIEAVGLFTAMYYLLTAVVLFINAIGHTLSARLARLYARAEAAAFRRLLGRLALLGAVVGLTLFGLALLFGEAGIARLYGEQFRAAAGVLTLLMAAAGPRFAASLLQFGVVASRQFATHLVIQAIMFILAVFLNLALVAQYGLAGAGWAVITVSVIHLAVVARSNLVLIGRAAAGARP